MYVVSSACGRMGRLADLIEDRPAGMIASMVASWLVMTGCAGASEPGPDAGPDAGAPLLQAQGGPPRGDLVINEVAPRPHSGPDWIELVNRGHADIDLCAYLITDQLDRLDHYGALGGALPPEPCAPVWLEPGAYLVILADDTRAPGHAPFRLGEAEEVHVVTSQGLPMDAFIYLYPQGGAGASLARVPDAQGLFHLAEASPGAANPEVGQ